MCLDSSTPRYELISERPLLITGLASTSLVDSGVAIGFPTLEPYLRRAGVNQRVSATAGIVNLV